ncbi:hypothetical protein K0651_09755 [Ornithinimicrobium sp. Arc0846-15]|nr:hypothetical protein [Ornithinimicrobium laminariae]
MERLIDFSRDRHVLCGACRQRFLVDLAWVDRWERGHERCTGCGLTCEHENAPRVTVDHDDPALDDDCARMYWYHTSTQPDWPTRDFDPAANLTPETRSMMGGEVRVAAWESRQQAKALHVGTFEAAVYNMLRRIGDQADRGYQFYLYRVRLIPSVIVRKDWLLDPSNFVGDVVLEEVCPPGVDVARYLNYHEDPGGLSLALGRDAIASVQRVAVPIPASGDDAWARESLAALEIASNTVVPTTERLRRFLRPSSPQAVLSRELAAALADGLPVNLREQFASAAAFDQGDNLAQWARRTRGLFDLIDDPEGALAALDRQESRLV